MYIKRDQEGKLVAVSLNPETGFVQEDGEIGGEVTAFMAASRYRADLAATDLEFVRVLDDLLEVLMAKGVMNFTDLPVEAQHKMLKRNQLRKNRDALDLLDDEGLI